MIKGNKTVKLLGIKINNKLDFNEHISNIYKKASLKLQPLARIAPYMNKEKLRILMKTFTDAQFNYCPLIWMFHSITWKSLTISVQFIQKSSKHQSLSKFLKRYFPSSQNPYELRNKNICKTENIHTVFYGSETVTFRGSKTWALITDNIKTSNNLNGFKAKIKSWKPEGCACIICKVYVQNLGFIS